MPSTHFNVNTTPSGHSITLYTLISTMLAANWTMVMSSDGTTSGAGVHVTSGSTGAGGLGNTDAWVVMQQPTGNVVPYSGTRQIMLQVQNSTASGIRLSYSRSAGYTGGTATQSPTATDEQFFAGGGTSASPTFYTWINTAAPGYRCETMADDGTAGSTFPFGFYLICMINGGGSSQSGCVGAIFMDPVQNYETGDSDPFVFFCGMANTGCCTYNGDVGMYNGGPVTDVAKTGNGQGFAKTWNNASALNALPAVWGGTSGLFLEDGSGSVAPGNMGTSPVTGNDVNPPVVWCRLATRPSTTGWKGVSMMLRYRGANRLSGSTQSVSSAGAKDFIVFNDLVVPWNGSAPTV